MFNFTFIQFAVFALFIVAALGKVYNRCSLAREMSKLGVPKDELARWTCIAKHESRFNTNSIGPSNSDGSHDYGIFQINDKYWCSPPSGPSANQCNVKCKDLLIDSVAPSVTCARNVLKRQGWQAWSVWKHCSGKLPSINDCF